MQANPPPTATTASVPTMRVAVELGYVRACQECRSIAERAAVAAIHDTSVTAFRAVPGAKHAHAVHNESGVSQHLEGGGDASTAALDGQNRLFEPTPQSDVNGFDPANRT